jgi:glycosyltransferase involved in cell wall biosynthesis
LLWHVHDFVGCRPVARRLLHWARRKVSGAVAVSEAVAEDLRCLWPATRVWVIPNAVDVDEFAPAAQHGDWLDKQAGVPVPPPGTLRIGLPATYARWKGHAVFLQAVARYLAAGSHPPTRFYVIGGPIYHTHGSQVQRQELVDLARREGVVDRVAFVDFQQDMVPVYRALDIVVHASTEPEPFGMTILEAMACGKPVIAAQAGGAAEIFESGHDALGTPPGDVQALTSSLLLLASNPLMRERLGARARETTCRRFSQERLSSQMWAVFQELHAGRSAAASA